MMHSGEIRQEGSDQRVENIRNDDIIDESTIVFEDETDDGDLDSQGDF